MATTVGQKDRLGTIERWLELVLIIFVMMLAFWFFSTHENRPTGFFTEEFGTRERMALYVPLYLSMVPPVMRAALGSRNAGRPWEVLANLGLAVGTAWLFFVFPFDFTHFADALPEFMQFPVSWVGDGIARAAMVLQIFIALLTAGGALWRYFSFERE